MVPAQADLIDLVNIFEQKKGRADKVLLAGVSEGGLIATLLAERTPSVFDGVLALCGPYGSFTGQVDYIGDFRVLFDYYFPGLLPPTPVDIPDSLLTTWETETYSTTIKPVIDNPANSATVVELLKVGGVAYSPSDPASRERSVERMLWYNVYATDDAAAKLGGQPFNNQQPLRIYTGSSDDAALNAAVARFEASPDALLTMATQYQTSGRIKIPVVTLHTTLDPVVPIWHQTEYTAKVQAAGASSLYEDYQDASYGHCAFNPLQVLSAFNKLTTMVDQVIKPQLYLPVISPAHRRGTRSGGQPKKPSFSQKLGFCPRRTLCPYPPSPNLRLLYQRTGAFLILRSMRRASHRRYSTCARQTAVSSKRIDIMTHIQTALITGASRGLGKTLAQFLAAQGTDLILTARGSEALAAAASELSRFGGRTIALAGDVADANHRRALAQAAEELGGLDLLVNNASILGPSPLPSADRLSAGVARTGAGSQLPGPTWAGASHAPPAAAPPRPGRKYLQRCRRRWLCGLGRLWRQQGRARPGEPHAGQ